MGIDITCTCFPFTFCTRVIGVGAVISENRVNALVGVILQHDTGFGINSYIPYYRYSAKSGISMENSNPSIGINPVGYWH